jgi:hypothetical protein
MSGNRLLLAGLTAGLLGVAAGCQSGDGAGGSVGRGGRNDFNGLLGGQGFGTPPFGAAPAGDTNDAIVFTPGFGAPPYSANAGVTAGTGAAVFTPGFGGPPSGSASVPGGSPGSGGRRVSDLTEAEAEELCESLAEQYDGAFGGADGARLSCTFAALAQSTRVDTSTGQQVVDPEACEAALEDCLASGAGDATTFACDPDEFLAGAGSCDASIGEVQACFDAIFSRADELFEGIDCQSGSDPAEVADALSRLTAAAPPCVALQSACPGLFDMGEPSGGAGTGGSGGTGGGGSGSGGSGGSGGSQEPPGGRCENTCRWPNDGACDDGGPGSQFGACPFGTDCGDCGPR